MMADTTTPEPTVTQTIDTTTHVTSGPTQTMNVGPTGQLAGGIGFAGVISFGYDWLLHWINQAPPAPEMDMGTATSIALLLVPVVHYCVGWLPMPPARNRRT